MSPDDTEKIKVTALVASRQKSFELLLDYAKFHIGLYLTLTASYIAATATKSGNGLALNIEPKLVWPAVVCFMVAGLAGGVIASSITQSSAQSSESFLEESTGPWNWKPIHFRARVWTWIEHTAFWIGLFIAAVSASPK